MLFFSLPLLATRLQRLPTRLLLTLVGLLAISHEGRASHALGSDMYYVNVAPDVYLVTYRLYRDCSGISAPPSMQLYYSATGCDSSGMGTNVGGQRTLTRRGYYDANPYCNLVNSQSPCDTSAGVSGAAPNFQVYSYSGFLSLGITTNHLCRNWTLLCSESARPELANIDFGNGSNLVTIAHLNNWDTHSDSSPVFSIIDGLQPLAFMCPHTPIQYNAGVMDTDGDSLVYSLAPAYTDQPGTGFTGQASYVNSYTPTEPVRVDPPPGSVPFDLNAQTGTLSFISGSYVPVGNSAQGDNKFVVVVQVDAYRRMSGQTVKTATVRRDLAVVIVNCPSVPVAPQLTGLTALVPGRAPVSYAPGDVVQAYVNEPLTLLADFSIGNQDSLFASADPASVPAGATFTPAAGISTVQTSLLWTPTTAGWQPQTLYLGARSNSCPVALKACFAIPISVAALRPTGLRADYAALRSTVAPNPFTTEARLTLAPGSTVREVLITDALGRVIERLPVTAGQRTLTWRPTSTLPAGLYYVRCADSKAVALVKL